MGLFSFLRGDDLVGQKALTATTGVLEVASARQFSPYISLGSSPNARRADRINSVYVASQNASYGWIYSYNPPVRSVIEYIAGNVAQLGLKVYKRVSDDEREHVGDHPAAQALRTPNQYTPGQQFLFDFLVDYLIFDNAYGLKIPSTNGLTIVGIPPHLVGIIGQGVFTPDAYRIWRADGSYFDIPPERMIHFRGRNPQDPRRGESKLETAREELAAYAASRQAVTELYRSGLALPGWVERPIEAPEISAEGLKRLQEDLANQAQSAKRRPPIFEEGMSFHQGGVTPEDAELLEAKRYTVEQIAVLFGMRNVPPQGDEERMQFYVDVLSPLVERLADFLNLQVLVQEYGASDHYFEFNLDEKLMGDDRMKAMTSAAGAPVLTRNEARARLNLPPKKGGDELIIPDNVSGGGKPSIDVMPIQDPNKPPQDGSHRSGEADKPAAAGTRSLPEAEPVHYKAEMNGNGHKAQPLVPRRRKASDRRDRWASAEYEPLFRGFFERQERVTKSKQLKAVSDDRWDNELASDLLVLYLRQFEAEGKHAAFRLASSFEPEFGHNWLASKAVGAAKDINRVTQEHIDQQGLEEAFSQAKDVRAQGAAVAMATDVAGFATKVALEQSPGEGMVTIDGGECEVCAPYQGTWPVSDLEAWPAYHPSCGCIAEATAAPGKSLVPQTKDATPVPAQPQPIHLHVNNTMPGVDLSALPEGLVKVESHTPVTVEGAQPAEVNVTTAPVNVAPANVNFEKGAIEGAKVDIAPPPPAQVSVNPEFKMAPPNVTFEKGAMEGPTVHVDAAPAPEVRVENTVEAPPPAEFKLEKDAIRVEVAPADVTVEAAPAPSVNVNVKGGKTTKTVKFSDGRTAEINESEEDDRGPDQD